ncbi:MAG: periplasmic heavy metal sensor [Shimia sp.]|nr:periplasmic heavy metal sensor [Shimia sp.]
MNTKLLYQQTLAVLRAETFDADAFGEVLKDIDRGSEGRRDLAREQLVARIASMSPEQRAGYADRLEEVLSRTSDKRGKPPKDGG